MAVGRKGQPVRLGSETSRRGTDGTMRSFWAMPVLHNARRIARSPTKMHHTEQRCIDSQIASLTAASEKNFARKALLERARVYIRTFLHHGVRRRQADDLGASDAMTGVVTPDITMPPVATASVPGSSIVHEARRRRNAFELQLAAEEEARAMACEMQDSSCSPPTATLMRSFRQAVKEITDPYEVQRAKALQDAANERLRAHHDATVGRGPVVVTSIDDRTTLVRVALANFELDLDKSAVSKKSLPKLLKRRLNTLLTPEQLSPGCVVIVSEFDSDAVVAVWLPGGLSSDHGSAREHARLRHYVNGGWAKGCAAEPVTSPERLAVLWNDMLRLRAYGLNEDCTFVTAQPCGSSYRLIYRNRFGTLTGFQMGSWIDRAQLSRHDLLQEKEYVDYDGDLHDTYRRAVTAALQFEGELSATEIEKHVSKLHLGLLASNFLDSRTRYVPCHCDPFIGSRFVHPSLLAVQAHERASGPAWDIPLCGNNRCKCTPSAAIHRR